MLSAFYWGYAISQVARCLLNCCARWRAATPLSTQSLLAWRALHVVLQPTLAVAALLPQVPPAGRPPTRRRCQVAGRRSGMAASAC